MTVLAAAEAPAAAEATSEAVTSSAARSGARSKAGTRTTSRGTTIVRGSGGTRVSTSREGQRAMPKPEPAPEPAPEPERKSRRQQVGGRIPRQKISRTNYQPVILMEFVACILLTAATPVATKKNQQGLSPYAGADIVKLSAITVVYLILAMLSVGGRTPGRLAAWFGGLILLADGLYEASNIVKDLQLLGGGGTAKAGTVAGGPAPAPAGGILPTPSGTQPVLGEAPSG